MAVLLRRVCESLVMVVMVLAMVCLDRGSEAVLAKVETFNPASCGGSPTNTFYVNGNTCQTFNDQGAVRISSIPSSTRVSVHNQRDCEAYSSVAQIYGPPSSALSGFKVDSRAPSKSFNKTAFTTRDCEAYRRIVSFM